MKKIIYAFILLLTFSILSGCNNIDINNSDKDKSKQPNIFESSNLKVPEKEGWLYFWQNGELSSDKNLKNNRIIKINIQTNEIKEVYKGREYFYNLELKDEDTLVADYSYLNKDDISGYSMGSILINLNTGNTMPYDNSFIYNDKKAERKVLYKNDMYFLINQRKENKGYDVYKKYTDGMIKYLFSTQVYEINIINNRIYYNDNFKIYSRDLNGNDEKLVLDFPSKITALSVNNKYGIFNDENLNTIICDFSTKKTFKIEDFYYTWVNVFYDDHFYFTKITKNEDDTNYVSYIYKVSINGNSQEIASIKGEAYKLYIYEDNIYIYVDETGGFPINYNDNIYKLNTKTNDIDKIA